MKRFTRPALVLSAGLFALSLSACQQSVPQRQAPGGVAPSVPPVVPVVAGPMPTASAPGPATPQVFGGQGTVAIGGGGNGLDGKMMERYHQKIEDLPEYKRYILPVLRRMSQGRPDVLVAYLQWVARQKAWYFVPKELPLLSREKTQLPIGSEQWALHYEKEIYIDSGHYKQQSAQGRADLLMHELVMGAKFLMKKDPKSQCLLLSRHTEHRLCGDPEVMKLVIGKADARADEPKTLDGIDHANIRSMTVFLMDTKQDLSGSAVRAARVRLSFVFPWDDVLSDLGVADLRAALHRVAISKESFVAKENFIEREERRCNVRLSYGTADYSSFQIDLLTPQEPIGVKTVMDIYLSDYQAGFLSAEGVMDPGGSGQLVDRLRLRPTQAWSGRQDAGANAFYFLFLDVYVTRARTPRITRIEVQPVAPLGDQEVERHAPGFGSSEDWMLKREYEPILTMKPVVCLPGAPLTTVPQSR